MKYIIMDYTADVIAALHFPCKPFDGYGIGSRIWVCRWGFGFRCGGGSLRRRGGFGNSRMRRGGVLCVFVVGSLAGCKNKCGQHQHENKRKRQDFFHCLNTSLKLRVICSLPQRIFSRRVRGVSAQIVFCKGANSDAVLVYNYMITYQSNNVNPVLP